VRANAISRTISHPLLLLISALHHHEHFVWPTRGVGHETDVEIDGRVITVRTLAEKPRLFELINLLGTEECDEL
jgi:hypothetical protein